MLVNEIDHREVPSGSGLNLQNVDEDVTYDNSEKTHEVTNSNDSYFLTTQPSFLYENESERLKIPAEYQFLPEEFFLVEGLPPPLVSISWMSLVNDTENEEDSGEDLPLSKLKTKLEKKKKIKKKGLKSSEADESPKQSKKSSKRNKVKKSQNDFSPVKRKRGRPRKCDKEPMKPNTEIYNNPDKGVQSDNDDFYWNEDYPLTPKVILEEDVNSENEKDNSTLFNLTDHDYFKAPEVSSSEEKSEVQGVKTEDSKITFPCVQCGKEFSAASTLKSHLRIHNGTLLICTECYKGFTTKYLLKCHMRIHNGDLFMCHKCGKGFTTAELLKVHSRGHTGDRPFFCNVCKKSFLSASNLMQHKQTHNSEKKFLCFQCGSSFSQKRCLDSHMVTHAKKNHICNVCGKLWARKSDLSEHMRVHTGVKPYCCDLCPQKFTQASSLKRHKLVHTGGKPIQCLTCNKMFKCLDYYKKHQRKHGMESDYLLGMSDSEATPSKA